MACTSMTISCVSPAAATAGVKEHPYDGMHRSESGSNIRCKLGGMRRSRSEPQLRCSLKIPRAASSEKIKISHSIGIFPFSFSGSMIPSSLRSFLFDSEEASGGMTLVNTEEIDEEIGSSGDGMMTEKRANWVERILELRGRWRGLQRKDEEDEDDADGIGDYYCNASYDSEEGENDWDLETFSRFLTQVGLPETKLFSQLAFLCNMAYVIPEIKAEDLRKCYDLWLVTSSLEKKSEAAIKAKLDSDSTRPPRGPTSPDPAPEADSKLQRIRRPSVAYDIASSAASYVHSRAKDLLSLGGGSEPNASRSDAADTTETRGERLEGSTATPSPGRVYKSEVAAMVAASTMTAVVAAEEEARLEAAKGLQSLHSSPCEWFVCDDPRTCTRCFVIQGSDSLASWQANLFFEPTKFEGMEVLVHRGIYEAAKGIYEQFMPEIQSHLRLYGNRARLRFTGHSLGGSLSLLVNLMLLTRGVVPASFLLPVVTFGSPSVFCGGRRVLDELGLDEGHILSVMMHRDIVPRAFSCNYPNHVAQVLKSLNRAFRSHPCLNNEKLLYSPLGKLFILQPDEKSSPAHPLLPPGAAVYLLDGKDGEGGTSKAGTPASALKAFLNSPHPLETLSDPTAYGSDGTILRDHDSSNYLKAVNGLLRRHTKSMVQRSRRQQFDQWWPLLTTPTAASGLPRHSWNGHHGSSFDKQGLVGKEVATGA